MLSMPVKNRLESQSKQRVYATSRRGDRTALIDRIPAHDNKPSDSPKAI